MTTLLALDGSDKRELLRTAAAVESRSSHPLAQDAIREAETEGVDDLPEAGDLQSVTGRGVRTELNGQVVGIGNLKLFETVEDPSVPAEIVDRVEALEVGGKTIMVVHDRDRFLGIIGLADQPRNEAPAMLDRLRDLGIRVLVMLTGDNERVAAAVAETVGLTDYRANLLAEEKAVAIHELLARHGQVAMAGDGANNGDAVYPGIVPRRGVSLYIHTLECYPSRFDADDCSLDFRGWPFPNPG